MAYIENPKTKGSGIICCIPQKGECPNKCSDCFFQSGRSYLEPLEQNLPNIPSVEEARGRIVRINDGNDSNVQRDLVMKCAQQYENYFYNTAIPRDLEGFKAPVVLTVNPGKMTDSNFHKIEAPKNLMFVRVRTNVWNIDNVVKPAVEFYKKQEVPVVLTFMRYYTDTDEIRKESEDYYACKKRIMNRYWCITDKGIENVSNQFKDNSLVYLCGGPKESLLCKSCGNCLREYFATKERMNSKKE